MIDLSELERELRSMKPRQQLYELVKRVLSEQGHWKRLGRGRPFKKL